MKITQSKMINLTNIMNILFIIIVVIFIYVSYTKKNKIYQEYKKYCNTHAYSGCDSDLEKSNNPSGKKICCPPYYCNKLINKCIKNKYKNRKFLKRT